MSTLHAPAPVVYDLGGYLADTLCRFPPQVRRDTGITRDPRRVTCPRCLAALSEHVQWHNWLLSEAKAGAP